MTYHIYRGRAQSPYSHIFSGFILHMRATAPDTNDEFTWFATMEEALTCLRARHITRFGVEI